MAKILGGLFALGLISAFVTWVFMLLWNYFVPMFFNNPVLLSFWQAWGFLIFMSFFKSFCKGK